MSGLSITMGNASSTRNACHRQVGKIKIVVGSYYKVHHWILSVYVP